jgi:hypothetical protein
VGIRANGAEVGVGGAGDARPLADKANPKPKDVMPLNLRKSRRDNGIGVGVLILTPRCLDAPPPRKRVAIYVGAFVKSLVGDAKG